MTKENKRRKARGVWWLVGLIIIALLIIWLIKLGLTPSHGRVTTPTITPGATHEANEYNAYQSQYLSFEYPSNFGLKEKGTDPKFLSRDIFVEELGQNEVSKLVVNVESLQGKDRAENSGLMFRRAYPKQYMEERFSQPNKGWGEVFTKQDGDFEKVLFLEKYGKLVTVALTSNGTDRVAWTRRFEAIVESLKWNDVPESKR